MLPTALIFGSVGVLTDTIDIERRAFNTAFEEHDLFWHWDAKAYRTLLAVPGRRARLRYYAMTQGIDIDIDALLVSAFAAFERATERGVAPRAGVSDVLSEAENRGVALAVADTSRASICGRVMYGLRAALDADSFVYRGTREHVLAPKPSSEVYLQSLDALDVDKAQVVVIENTVEGCEAALAAGLQPFAYPPDPAFGARFPAGVRLLTALNAQVLHARIAA